MQAQRRRNRKVNVLTFNATSLARGARQYVNGRNLLDQVERVGGALQIGVSRKNDKIKRINIWIIKNKIKSKNNRNLVLLISSFAIQKQGLRENGFRADQRDLGPMFWFNMSSWNALPCSFSCHWQWQHERKLQGSRCPQYCNYRSCADLGTQTGTAFQPWKNTGIIHWHISDVNFDSCRVGMW